MTIAELAHPEWLGIIVAGWVTCALALGGSRWVARRRRTTLMGDPRSPTPTSSKWVSDVALLVALGIIGAGLLGPRIGERTVEVSSSGVDLVVLVDLSRSMDAGDTPPSRLDRARRAVEEILARLEPSDRVALTAFASRGVILTPLTPDRGAVGELLGALDTQLIHPASSDLGAGVRAAVEAFEPGGDRPRVLLVVSDGEDPGRRPEIGIREAVGASARVIAVAVGTELGAGVPDKGAPLRDAVGQLVVTRRHSERLARLVEATGGTLFETDAWGAIDFDAATAKIRRDVGAVPGEMVERRVPVIAVTPFAVIALALLLLEGLPRRRLAWAVGPRIAAATLLALPLIGAAPRDWEDTPLVSMLPDRKARVEIPSGALEAWTREHPGHTRLLLALGRARLSEGEPAGAARAFAAAAVYARDPEVAARAYYGLGVAELEREEHARARDAFFDALAFDIDDHRARFNLEWTLLALERQPPEPPPALTPPPDPTAAGESNDEAERAEADEPEPTAPAEPKPGDPSDSIQKLDETQRMRALERVQDDLARSVRTAARADEPRRRRSEPAW